MEAGERIRAQCVFEGCRNGHIHTPFVGWSAHISSDNSSVDIIKSGGFLVPGPCKTHDYDSGNILVPSVNTPKWIKIVLKLKITVMDLDGEITTSLVDTRTLYWHLKGETPPEDE